MDLSRREFTKAAVAGSIAMGASGLLSACGGVTSTKPVSSTGKPKSGGTLQAAISGGSSSDSLDPLNPISNADFARVNNLFEPLVGLTSAAQPVYVLATDVIPNAKATQWIVKLRKGVTFHNGKRHRAVQAQELHPRYREHVPAQR